MEENNTKYQVFTVNNARYLTLTTKKFDNRKIWQKLDPKEICSIIPGSVVDIFAQPGQKFKAGEVVLILDAMKMYTKVTMPMDGVIKSVNVAKGDRVPKDMVMISIE